MTTTGFTRRSLLKSGAAAAGGAGLTARFLGGGRLAAMRALCLASDDGEDATRDLNARAPDDANATAAPMAAAPDSMAARTTTPYPWINCCRFMTKTSTLRARSAGNAAHPLDGNAGGAP